METRLVNRTGILLTLFIAIIAMLAAKLLSPPITEMGTIEINIKKDLYAATAAETAIELNKKIGEMAERGYVIVEPHPKDSTIFIFRKKSVSE